jgi:hypothetical protein
MSGDKAREIADKLEARVRNIVGGRNLEAEGITVADGYSENSFPAVSWPKRWLVDALREAIEAECEACAQVADTGIKGVDHPHIVAAAIRTRNKP